MSLNNRHNAFITQLQQEAEVFFEILISWLTNTKCCEVFFSSFVGFLEEKSAFHLMKNIVVNNLRRIRQETWLPPGQVTALCGLKGKRTKEDSQTGKWPARK